MQKTILDKIFCLLIIAILYSSTLQVKAEEDVLEWYEQGYSSTIHESKKKLKMKCYSVSPLPGTYEIYDKQGYLMLEQELVSQIEEHRYDDNGRLIKSIWRSLMDPDVRVTDYQKNKLGKMQIKKVCRFLGGSSLGYTEYRYDNQGREISCISYNSVGKEMGRTEKIYNTMGKEIVTIEYYEGKISERTEKAYDAKGNLLISISYDAKDQEKEKKENIYNEKGQLLVSAEYYGGEVLKRTEKWYDEKDNIIKELIYIKKYNGYSTVHEISYSEERIRKELIVNTKNNNYIEKESIPVKEYDQDGDLIAEYDLVTIKEYTCINEYCNQAEKNIAKDYDVKISQEIENTIYYEYYPLETE